MIEVANLRAHVERLDRVVAKRAEAHRADVETGRIIRLAALFGPYRNPRPLWRFGVRIDRMAQRLVFFRVYVQFGPEGVGILLMLRTCINKRAGDAVERAAIQRAFDDVTTQKGAEIFEQPAKAGAQRIVSPQRVGGLDHIPQRYEQQGDNNDKAPVKPLGNQRTQKSESNCKSERYPEAEISLQALVCKQSAHQHAKRPFFRSSAKR